MSLKSVHESDRRILKIGSRSNMNDDGPKREKMQIRPATPTHHRVVQGSGSSVLESREGGCGTHLFQAARSAGGSPA
jgi:hypothetical protein